MSDRKTLVVAFAFLALCTGSLRAGVEVDMPKVEGTNGNMSPLSGGSLSLDQKALNTPGLDVSGVGLNDAEFPYAAPGVGVSQFGRVQQMARPATRGLTTVTDRAQGLRRLSYRPAAGNARAAPLETTPQEGAAVPAKSRAAGIDLQKVQDVTQGPQGAEREGFNAAYDESVSDGFDALGVEGGDQTLSARVTQEVSIANRAPMADAPRLYQATIEHAEKVLPPAEARKVAAFVRGYAARRAAAGVEGFVRETYEDAAQSAIPSRADRFDRDLGAMEKDWPAVLKHPLIDNLGPLAADMRRVRDAASSPGAAAPSVPHAYVESKRRPDGSWLVAGLPGGGVESAPAAQSLVPALGAAQETAGAGAPPAAARGPGLAALAAAPLPAARYALSALEAAIESPKVYDLKSVPGREELGRDAGQAAQAAAGLARAEELLRSPGLAGARAGFRELLRSASLLDALTGRGDGLAIARGLNAEFEREVGRRVLSPGERLPPDLAALVSGPDGALAWAARLSGELERVVDSRVRPALQGTGVTLIGAAAPAARAAREMGRQGLDAVAAGSLVVAGGRGRAGKVELSLRAVPGREGLVALQVERGDDALAGALESLGLAVTRQGKGLLAELDSRDRPRGDLAALAAQAADWAMSGAPAARSAERELRGLIAADRRDHAAAERLARGFDGNPALSAARRIGTARYGGRACSVVEFSARGRRYAGFLNARGVLLAAAPAA